MNFDQAIASLGRPRSFGEAIAALRAQHGKSLTRFLADELGVTMRTAQRYAKGEFRPSTRTAAGRERLDKTLRAVDRGRNAARLLRNAKRVNVGRVRVVDRSSGKPAGTRMVGAHRVGDTLTAVELENVADLLDAGDFDSAAEEFSNAMLDAYSVSKNDPPGTASGPLLIVEYLTGIQADT